MQTELFPPQSKIREDFPITAKLSEHGAARHTDPKTAKAAAKSVDAGTLEYTVLECLHEHGPKTAEEMVSITKVAIDSITPRTAPLKRRGFIEDTGERRAGASGAKRIVWGLTAKGRNLFL